MLKSRLNLELSCIIMVLVALAARTAEPVLDTPRPEWRGVFFNPQLQPGPEFPWQLHYRTCRDAIKRDLAELKKAADFNLVAVYVLMPHTLATPKRAPRPGESIEGWANLNYLDQLALFIDDCHEAGLSVALDMANNLWVPGAIDPEGRRVGVPDDPPGRDPWWPVADDTPWDESIAWYTGIITYVEEHARHPEAIAWWCMDGNHALGGAEPVLWAEEAPAGLREYTERFVKAVWPAFVRAGKRPKAAPYTLPIFSATPYWTRQSADARLRGFSNLKQWLVDDLNLPPDYWPMSTYPYCDPAPDGTRYLQRIVEILGPDQAARIISTDWKGPGHEFELEDCMLTIPRPMGPEAYAWHLEKCREYGFGGWWIWAYQDTASDQSGLRALDGAWKLDRLAPLLKSTTDPR